MEYLLKASAVVAIFYLCYKLFLQRDTFFESNRGFLLLGLITAFTMPFVVIPIYIEYTPTAIPYYEINGDITTAENTEKSFNVFEYIPFVYLLGLVIFTFRFLFQVASLSSIIIKNKSEKQGPFNLIKTTNTISPFSFFNWIVYNPKQFNKTELELIITHEKIHVRQYHSIDILLTQLACILLWFNPFIWFYNKSLKQNLEFIADQNAQSKSECKKSYQHILLKTSMPTHQMALSNNFYNSLIKKRIVMLQKSKSKKRNLIKYSLVLPFLALFLMSYNTEKVYVEKEASKEKTNIIEAIKVNSLETPKIKSDEVIVKETSNNPASIATKIKSVTQDLKHFKVTITKDLTDADFKKIINEAKKNGITLKFSNIKRNSKNEIIAINAEFKNKKGSGNFNLNGKEPIKSFAFKQNDEGFGFGTEWATKFVIGKPMSNVQVIGYGDVKFEEGNKLISNDTLILNKKQYLITYTSKADTLGLGNSNTYLVYGDSIIFNKNNNVKFRVGVHSDSINNNQWEKAIGLPAPNSNISLFIKKTDSVKLMSYSTSLKTNDKNSSNLIISNGKNKDIIYILDDKEISEQKLKKLNHDNIQSITVLKDANAISEYGDKAKDGVIIITSKENNKELSRITLSTQNKNPLYILDGKKVEKKKFENLEPDNIESINVLKGKKAIEKYGKKAKDGVIEITTKKKK